MRTINFFRSKPFSSAFVDSKMKQYSKFFPLTLLLISLSCSSEQNCQEGIHYLPEYGRVTKCREQIEADEEFIADCDNRFENRREAAQYFVSKGWTYFRADSLDKAMMRFNQAWLLESINADVYWGFGNILGKRTQAMESIVYFNKSAELNPRNSNLWLSCATSYEQLFFQLKDTIFFDNAIINLKKSVAIDNKNAKAYEQLTACYAYFMQLDSARKYLVVTDKIDSTMINPEVRRILSKR